jgi:bacteriocin-type transport-associated protein
MRKVLFLLGQLDDSDVEWIIAHGTRQHVAAGTVLIQEGRAINSLYILLDGVLEVSGTHFAGNPIRLSSGEIVGEMSMLDSRPPSATVIAAEDSVVFALARDELAAQLQGDAEFAARFYRSLAMFLSHRLRNVYQQLGYGRDESLEEDVQYQDELSPELLDNVHLAATRFDHVLQRLLGPQATGTGQFGEG